MKDLEKAREYKVVKHNDLIQKAKYNLSANQQKFIAYVISLIKPDDKELMMYEVSVIDFCDLCGINKEHFYSEFKAMLLDLDKKSFLVETKEKVFNFRWFSEFEYIKGKGVVKVQLNSNLKSYLLELYEHFTVYELYNILAIRGKYGLRLYELSQSWFNSKKQKEVTKDIDLDELKSILMATTYKDFKGFRRRVIEPSIKEISSFTDLEITYKPVKDGRKVTSIEFVIRRKDYNNAYIAYKNTLNRINKRSNQIEGQLSIFDMNECDFRNGFYLKVVSD